jgi:uroporphyrinogen decarboxylase
MVAMGSSRELTPRERVLSALRHEEPDRVPIDLGGFQTGIHRLAYMQLLEHLGLEEEVAIRDPVQQLAKPSDAVLERFRVDTRYLTANAPDGATGGIEHNERGGRLWHDLRDDFGVVWSMPDDQGLFMDISHHPLAEATVGDLDAYPWPDGSNPGRFRGLAEKACEVSRDGHFALCTGIGGVVYEYCWYLRGLERWFVDMMDDPAFCEALLERTLAFWLDFYTGLLAEVGDLVDVVMIGDDLAGQSGPLFSPTFYRRVVQPRQRKLVRHIRSLTPAKVWYHTCGACHEVIADLLDNGVDILNPVQIGIAGMDPAELKSEFGARLVFWGGGIDAQHVLPFATPAEVRDHVRRNMGAFKPGGGYVFNNVHNVQYGVPPVNVVALFDAAHEFGGYA